MGYTTQFTGHLTITPRVKPEDNEAYDFAIGSESWAQAGGEDHPGAYNQWTIKKYGTVLAWDNGETFYHYTDWLVWLCARFFAPRGYMINGRVEWQGEEFDDIGVIEVKGNAVSHQKIGLGNDVLGLASRVLERVHNGNDVPRSLQAALAKAIDNARKTQKEKATT